MQNPNEITIPDVLNLLRRGITENAHTAALLDYAVDDLADATITESGMDEDQLDNAVCSGVILLTRIDGRVEALQNMLETLTAGRREGESRAALAEAKAHDFYRELRGKKTPLRAEVDALIREAGLAIAYDGEIIIDDESEEEEGNGNAD